MDLFGAKIIFLCLLQVIMFFKEMINWIKALLKDPCLPLLRTNNPNQRVNKGETTSLIKGSLFTPSTNSPINVHD